MNSKWNSVLSYWLTKYLAGIFLVTSSFPLLADNQDLLNKVQQLNNEFITLSTSYYKNFSTIKSSPSSNIDNLISEIITLDNNNRPTEAIQLIYNNIPIIEESSDHQRLPDVIEILLNHSEVILAESLFQQIKDDSDNFEVAVIQFIFAKYYATQLQWLKVDRLLKDVPKELTEADSAYATLLQGTALQHLKKHRQAQKIYTTIPVNSSYYHHAQLNIAIAQIRQGWLTSATNTINNLIHEKGSQIDDEFTNRLYLVLGYAFLQRDYFRNSRDVFRKISQTSHYANRALLGLALCAVNQKEYQSALNTLSVLKAKNIDDLSVAESYLLMTYVYEKSQHDEQVVASSTEAMNYYQQRIADLLSITQKHVDFSLLKIEQTAPVLLINNNEIDYGDIFPVSFIINYQQLLRLMEINKDRDLAKQIELLLVQYDEAFQLIIKTLISKKISHLKSYLNQVRYGLARLYDDSAQEVQ